jgi:hypothetical protein
MTIIGLPFGLTLIALGFKSLTLLPRPRVQVVRISRGCPSQKHARRFPRTHACARVRSAEEGQLALSHPRLRQGHPPLHRDRALTIPYIAA